MDRLINRLIEGLTDGDDKWISILCAPHKGIGGWVDRQADGDSRSVLLA